MLSKANWICVGIGLMFGYATLAIKHCADQNPKSPQPVAVGRQPIEITNWMAETNNTTNQ